MIPSFYVTCKVFFFKTVHDLIIDTPIGCLADFSARYNFFDLEHHVRFALRFYL